MHAIVTAYKGRVVIELKATKSIPNQVTTSLDNPSNQGQVVHNTHKFLGVSPEALELLKTLKKGTDSLGIVDWLKTSEGSYSFGWMGGPYFIGKVEELDTSRDWEIGSFVSVPNDVPAGAKEAIDEE